MKLNFTKFKKNITLYFVKKKKKKRKHTYTQIHKNFAIFFYEFSYF